VASSRPGGSADVADGRASPPGTPTTEPELLGGSTWSYRPQIDGLRAVAVYLVLAFHAGLLRWSGGFIGVDVFFVLSGYLVTNLLVRDLASTHRVGFSRFYSRRVRRLLPAAAVNLVVVAVVFGAIAAPVELPQARDSIRAAALYVSNWYFIRESANYFGAAITSSPVAQYWSLSVEEQFYVVWPLLIFGLFRLGRSVRHAPAVMRTAVGVGGLASLIAALYIATDNPNRAYYGTDTRAYQLMAGAFLALTPAIFEVVRRSALRRWLPAITLALLAAIVGLASSAIDIGPITRGAVTTLLVVSLIVSLEASAGGLARRLLSIPPITYLGQISYGTYLWHWIIILVATERLSMAPLPTFAVTVALATGLATLSYELLEHPIRTSALLGRHRIAVIACGLAVSALIGISLTPRLLTEASAKTTVASSPINVGGTPNHANWAAASFDIAHVSGSACNPNHVDACVVHHGTGPKVLIAGDSHAEMLTPMFVKLAEHDNLDLTLAPLPYCPWTWGVRYQIAGRKCYQDQKNLYEKVIPEVDPDIVILAHRAVDDPLNPLAIEDQKDGVVEGTAATAALRDSITTVVDRLRHEGRKVVLIEPIPVSSREDNPLTCLSKARYLEQCRYVTHTSPLPEEQIFRALAANDPGVVSVDLDRQVCPYLPICDPLVKGIVVKHDDNHITKTFAMSLLGYFQQILVANGILK
jgi:peptidoglycan/LPS O-acetylase OafA/YrhL